MKQPGLKSRLFHLIQYVLNFALFFLSFACYNYLKVFPASS